MAISLGSLKGHAHQSQVMKAGLALGNYRAKLVSLIFELTRTGKKMVVSEWLIINAYDITGEDKSRGKKVKLRFVCEGAGSEFGLANLGAHMAEICKDTGHDLDAYVTDVDYDQLFLELATFTVVKELSARENMKNPQYPNCSIKTDRTTATPRAAATAPVEQLAAQPAPAAVAPAPAPTSAASALFSED